MPSNPFELAVALFFQSSAMLDEIKSFEQPFEALILSASDDLQLLMTFSSWWKLLLVISLLMRCFWWRQHFRSTLSSEPLFFRCFKLPSFWFHCSHLFFQTLCFKNKHYIFVRQQTKALDTNWRWEKHKKGG